MEFDSPTLGDFLFEDPAHETLDALPFGVIGINEDDEVVRFNVYEQRSAGLSLAAVEGQDLFVEVAPCFNNFMVAERLEEETELDEIIPYVLTLKMKPKKVSLRLLKRADKPTRYIAVQVTP